MGKVLRFVLGQPQLKLGTHNGALSSPAGWVPVWGHFLTNELEQCAPNHIAHIVSRANCTCTHFCCASCAEYSSAADSASADASSAMTAAATGSAIPTGVPDVIAGHQESADKHSKQFEPHRIINASAKQQSLTSMSAGSRIATTRQQLLAKMKSNAAKATMLPKMKT